MLSRSVVSGTPETAAIAVGVTGCACRMCVTSPSWYGGIPVGREPALEDPHDVATGHRHLEEEPVVPHEDSVADAAPTQ